MKKRQGGFIKGLIVAAVAVCILFIVLAVAARYVATATGGNGGLSTLGGIQGPTGANHVGRPNPLLPDLPLGEGGSYSSSYDSPANGSDSIDPRYRSPYAGRVILSSGDTYTSQPFEEYVTLRNTGAAVSITGWTFTNSKGTRPIENSQNSYYYPTADSATIGEGTEFLNPSGRFSVGPIVLKTGDTAIVTTGKAFAQFPFSIYTSFRENICQGYLENYPFTPSLRRACPYPTNDPDIRSVTEECYDYLSGVGQCVNPETKDKKRFDETLTSQCKAFIRVRLNYPACVANNSEKAGFSLNQWRVFLGKDRELWSSRRETITLYDQNGLIVDQLSY